jgi:CDP-archaeol synthase
MQPAKILQLVILLAVANGTPVIAKDILGNRFSYPVDAHVRFADGGALFGASKTIRGILLSLLMTSVWAPLVGLEWQTGLLVGSTAMGGDLFSSFWKRRIHLPPGGRATGLDQVPESLFPLLACAHALSLTLADILVSVGIFFVGEIFLSRLLFKLRLRDRPY